MGNKTLAEAAQEIFNASKAKAPADPPKKLPDAKAIDTGPAIVNNDDAGKVYNRTVSKDKSEPTKNAAPAETLKKMKASAAIKEDEDIEIKVKGNKNSDDDEDDDDSSSKDEKIKLDGKDVGSTKSADDGDDSEENDDDSGDDEGEEDEKKKNPFVKESRRSLNTALSEKIEIDVSEDIDAMFSGTELSEEFTNKVATIYEAAVTRKVKQIQEQLAAEYDEILGEEIEKLDEEHAEQIEEFLEIVSKEWLSENKVAIENNLRNELTESFIAGMKNLFAEHYIDVPENKVDIVEAISAENEELKALLDEEYSEKMKTNKYVTELEKSFVLSNLVKEHNLTLTQEEKVKELVENVRYTDADAFSEKVNTLIESYIKKPSGEMSPAKKIIAEEVNIEESKTESVAPDVAGMVKALSRFAK